MGGACAVTGFSSVGDTAAGLELHCACSFTVGGTGDNFCRTLTYMWFAYIQ